MLVAAVVGGCVWYAQGRMTAIDDAYSVFLVREARAPATARWLNRIIYTLNYAVIRIIAEPEQDLMRRSNATFDDASSEMKAVLVEMQGQAPTFSGRIETFATSLDDFTRKLDAVRKLAMAGKNANALDLYHRTIDPVLGEVIRESNQIGTDIQTYVATSSNDLTLRTNATRHQLIALTALGMVLGLLAVGLITVLGVTRPIGRLVRVLDRMAHGEIEAEIPEARRGDEIGVIGRAVEGIKAMVAQKAAEQAEIKRIADAAAGEARRRTMMALADGFEQAVGGIVGRVASSATELEATAGQMSGTATETASQSAAVAAAAEQAASNVGTVAAAAEELGASVAEIGRQVDGSAGLAKAAVAEADRTGARVRELSQTVSRIGDVAGLISSIAAQTNLLALNATIEAARAGAAGRGFAVVAAEVKELASQTAKATEEIGQQIAAVQGATGETVSAITAITERIREIDAVTVAIAAAVEEQGVATQEIVRNVSQAATGTGEVTGNIAGVAGAAEETGAAAAQVLASATELSRQSEHLGAEVARFLATVRAA
ncbi:methyl-accepting chemotaxis protein [Methylobacterium currus]|uniref:methyl-accepting chemotaxis protein n=1 Tax=Methylobacterium currus TaxID=2051553 RepID=UPI001E43CE20|nr:methyl-accepting chemotaxis protein [Methylobacterium currus]UHC19129.1 methyl-accepting chemotaxis protein [Methylobacterium currus]